MTQNKTKIKSKKKPKFKIPDALVSSMKGANFYLEWSGKRYEKISYDSLYEANGNALVMDVGGRRPTRASDFLGGLVDDFASPCGSNYEIADMDDLVADYVEENEKKMKVQNQEFGYEEIRTLVGEKGVREQRGKGQG